MIPTSICNLTISKQEEYGNQTPMQMKGIRVSSDAIRTCGSSAGSGISPAITVFYTSPRPGPSEVPYYSHQQSQIMVKNDRCFTTFLIALTNTVIAEGGH